MKRIAIYPGTFDPITKGHLDIILRSAELVDVLVVAIANDSTKTPLFSLTERVNMAKHEILAAVDHEPIASKIEVTGFSGLLINFVKSKQANLIIRGLRAISDFEYEFQLFSANCKLDNSIETIFLPAKDDTHFISATMVKEIARLKGNVSSFVSPYISSKLADKF